MTNSMPLLRARLPLRGSCCGLYHAMLHLRRSENAPLDLTHSSSRFVLQYRRITLEAATSFQTRVWIVCASLTVMSCARSEVTGLEVMLEGFRSFPHHFRRQGCEADTNSPEHQSTFRKAKGCHSRKTCRHACLVPSFLREHVYLIHEERSRFSLLYLQCRMSNACSMPTNYSRCRTSIYYR